MYLKTKFLKFLYKKKATHTIENDNEQQTQTRTPTETQADEKRN